MYSVSQNVRLTQNVLEIRRVSIISVEILVRVSVVSMQLAQLPIMFLFVSVTQVTLEMLLCHAQE